MTGSGAPDGGRLLVMGDLHGADKALAQCLERSAFDPQKDRLIQLGDLCDGWPEVDRCLDRLMALPHVDLIVGNHDIWAMRWARTGHAPPDWTLQGGRNTIASYAPYPDGRMPERHIRFLETAEPWLEIDGKVFVHAGLDPEKAMPDQDLEVLVWDRDLVRRASETAQKFLPFDEVYVGHTPTRYLGGGSLPLNLRDLWMIDTDAGMHGCLTILDTATKEYWQSDPVKTLYPGVCPREAARGRWEATQ